MTAAGDQTQSAGQSARVREQCDVLVRGGRPRGRQRSSSEEVLFPTAKKKLVSVNARAISVPPLPLRPPAGHLAGPPHPPPARSPPSVRPAGAAHLRQTDTSHCPAAQETTKAERCGGLSVGGASVPPLGRREKGKRKRGRHRGERLLAGTWAVKEAPLIDTFEVVFFFFLLYTLHSTGKEQKKSSETWLQLIACKATELTLVYLG